MGKGRPPLLPTTMTSNPPSKRSSASARRVLHAAGKPLRRVSRMVSSSSRRSEEVALPVSYGSVPPPTSFSNESGGGVPPLSNNGDSLVVTSNGLLQERDWAVWNVERVLRQALLVLVAYLVGVSKPQWSLYAQRLLEWFGVAWMTCAVILVVSFVHRAKIQHDLPHVEEQRVPLLLRQQEPDTAVVAVAPLSQKRDIEEAPILDRKMPLAAHPSLERFYFIDKFTMERIVPNSGRIHILENDLLSGTMVAMIRTPDVDDPEAPMGNSSNTKVSNYFRDKQRRFEYQYQVKLKRKPEGSLCFSCEVDEPVRLGMVQRAFVGAAMAFMKTMNSSFHFCLNGGHEEGGRFEKVHVGFPVEMGFDRVVATKPGDPIPKLGEAIEEDPEVVKKRKKGLVTIDWNTEDTYTFAVWSAYADFLEWRVLNLPGIRPFDLASIVGPQPLNLVLYSIPTGLENGKHYRADMEIICDMEISNTSQTSLGPAARQWVAKHSNVIPSIPEEEGDVMGISPTFSLEDEEVAEEEEEAETVAELGEGMYLRSGDSVVLQEGFPDNSTDISFAGVLSNGGGFAVLQDRGSPTIVIEKTQRRNQEKNARSRLIKSGDKIMIKLVTKDNADKIDIKFLSIHRGWWLKWVSMPPTKNGFFTIHTQETEFNPSNGLFPASETQTSYLTLGGSFLLRHQRWSKYEVGVSAKESPTYGGRILGLYIPGGSNLKEEVNNPDDEEDAEQVVDETEGSRKNSWMRPLLLTAQTGSTTTTKDFPPVSPARSLQMTSGDLSVPITLSAGNFRIDVPGWIEMTNRTDRRRQLLYIVRIAVDQVPRQGMESASPEKANDEDNVITISRLRTGNELAELIRLGRDLKRKFAFPLTKRSSSDEGLTPSRSQSDNRAELELMTPSEMKRDEGEMLIVRSPSMGALGLEEDAQSFSSMSLKGSRSFDDDILIATSNCSGEADCDTESVESDDDNGDPDLEVRDAPDVPVEIATPSRSRRKKRKVPDLKSIAKSVKTGTSITGKKVVSGSKKVGKGTVWTGKAIIAPISRGTVHPKKPPVKEPKSSKRKANRGLSGRDHYVVVNRALRSMSTLAQPPSVLAGQLSAPDQSCRTASHILSGMCNEPEASEFSKRFIGTLTGQIALETEFDTWFLQGGAIQMGVDSASTGQKLLYECAVARCLWESHWREEWCCVYETGIYSYAPLTKEPSLVLSFVDVQSVRRLDIDECSPLPGYSLLAVDTAWHCHYFAFSTDEARDELIQVVNNTLFSLSADSGDAKGKGAREKDLWKARFWQGFQSSAESSLSAGQGKWATISSSSKMRHRTILNGRRMAFDIAPKEVEDDVEYLRQTSQFVEDLLSTSLSFSLASLEKDPDTFVKFHDATSMLRTLSLERIHRSSSESVCIFVNLYHCLLQHALLLTVNGPLNKRSAGHFMRCTCYEIGGDVFSLAELNCCVIRGNLSRPVAPKSPYVDVPKKSNAYRFYALDRVDTRINFVLNTGDSSCPQMIPVLTPDRLQRQLDAAAALFVQSQLTVDVAKRVITLPKICDVYRHDFGNGDHRVAIMFCVTFLSESHREDVIGMLQNESHVPLYVKHQPTSEHYYSCLKPWQEEYDAFGQC